MIFVIPEKKAECGYLQQQKEQKIRVLSDEEKNVTHFWYSCYIKLAADNWQSAVVTA
jgi:hypothetical protein